YRKSVTITVPYSGVGKLDLELSYQGCADVGFCYPPQHKHVDLILAGADAHGSANAAGGRMPGAAAAATVAAAPAASTASAVHPADLAALVNANNGGSAAASGNSFPPPDQVFRFSAVAKDAKTLALHWGITQGYYLYRQKFEIKSDQYLGTSEIYTQDVDVLVPVTVTNDASKFKLTVVYQGCAEAGLCYPPQTKTQDIDLAAAAPMTGAAPATSAPPVAEQDRLAALLRDGNILWVMLTFIGVGILLAFTPCVLPMIPILSGLIVGQGKKLTTHHAFALSLTYVLAMAAVYAVVGVVVGLLGSNIQLALQNPWVLGAFALIFVVLALSMFGLYELQMPSAIQSR